MQFVTNLSDDLVNPLLLDRHPRVPVLLDMLAGLSSYHGCQDVLLSNAIILSTCIYINFVFTFI